METAHRRKHMLPIVRIFALTIQTPLLAIMIGVTLAMSVAGRQADQRGLDGNAVANALWSALIAGVLGARIGYVLLNWQAYARDPLDALALNTTALSPWMGWLTALVFGSWQLWRQRGLNVKLLDALAPAMAVLAVGLAVGDLLSGNAYGTPAKVPWAINVWNANRHPVQIYGALALLLILVLLLALPRTWPDGAVMLCFVALYAFAQPLDHPSEGGLRAARPGCRGFARVLVDGFRADVPLLLGLRVTQLAGVLIAAKALWLLGELLQASPMSVLRNTQPTELNSVVE